MRTDKLVCGIVAFIQLCCGASIDRASADDWPRWLGPEYSGVSK